jgi:ElaB/YqjD/DUF883 family membrane-anchored ribosome-binding protein
MTTTTDTIRGAASDVSESAQEQIRHLRAQVDTLMRERVTPVIAEAAGMAQDAARQAQEIARDQTEAFQGRVREQPLTSVLIAAGVGYLVGRLMR